MRSPALWPGFLLVLRAHAEWRGRVQSECRPTDVLVGKAAGAAQQNLNAGIVKAFRLCVPSVVTQSRIGALLSAFDELIEVNERRIELLEDLVRSLYREWFVHFRFPGHEGVKFVDSTRGQIPGGWRVARFR